jgi:hypothetical protein
MKRKFSSLNAKRSCKFSILESVDYRRTIALHKYGITRLFRDDLSKEEFDDISNKYVEEIKCPELMNLDGSLNQSECVKVMKNATNRWPLIGSFIAQQAMGTDDDCETRRLFLLRVSKTLGYAPADHLIELHERDYAFIPNVTENSWALCLEKAVRGDGLLCYVVLWHVMMGTITMGDLRVTSDDILKKLWLHSKSSPLYSKIIAFRDASHENCDFINDLASQKELTVLQNFSTVTSQRGRCSENSEILCKLKSASTVSSRACVLAAMCAKKMKRDEEAEDLMKRAATEHECLDAEQYLKKWRTES